MNKEFREEMANVRSLMERMDKHYTAKEAEINRKWNLFEAVNTNPSGVMKPQVNVEMVTDKVAFGAMVRLTISPIFQSDARKIKSNPKFLKDPTCVIYENKTSKQFGIKLSKILNITSFRKFIKKPVAQKDNGTTNNTTAQQQQQTATVSDTQQTQSKKGSSLLNKLRAKNNVNEGLLDKLKSANGKTTATPQANTSNQTNNSAQTQSNPLKEWLKTTYLPIIQILAQNQNYDKASIDELMDIDNIWGICMGKPTEDDQLFMDESSEEMIKAVSAAIKSGNWSTELASILNPISLQGLIFGHVLSHRNIEIIKYICALDGVYPGSPDFPTMIFPPNYWRKYFKRKVIDIPKRRYPLVHPNNTVGYSGEQGTMAHASTLINKNSSDFGGYIGYDISDTEPEDPTVVNDFINDRPGILNNLTGELNQAAIDFKNKTEADLKNSLSDEDVNVLKELETAGGQAKIWNEAFGDYVQSRGIQIQFIEATDINTAERVYAENVYNFAKFSVESRGYSEPSLVDTLTSVLAFSIACLTCASKETLSLCSQKSRNGLNVTKDFKDNITKISQTMSNVINHMKYYVTTKYSHIGSAVDKASDNTTTDTSNVQNQQAQQPQAAQTQQISENIETIFNKIDNILSNF